jgi:hypothetical protein
MQNKSKEQYEEEINDLFTRFSEASDMESMDAPKKTALYGLTTTATEYIFSKHVIIKNKEEYGEEIFTT